MRSLLAFAAIAGCFMAAISPLHAGDSAKHWLKREAAIGFAQLQNTRKPVTPGDREL